MKANGLRGVATKYRALLWLLVDDDALRDHRVRRQVLAFGRELERLVSASTAK